MRVLQVAWEHPPRIFGGLGRHLEGLSAGLVASGVEVTVLTPHLLAGQRDVPPTTGLRVVRAGTPAAVLPDDDWIGAVLEANHAMVTAGLALSDPGRASHDNAPVDLLHAHDWMAGFAAATLQQVWQVPLVVTVHATERGRHMGHLPPGPSGWIDAQERRLVAQADAVLVCAEPMAQTVIKDLDADPPTTHVVGNGVDLACWQGAKVLRRDDLIVFAGRLEHEKGAHILLQATRDLPVDTIIAGTGTAESALRASAHPRARFTGRLEQQALAELLHQAAVVVVPSLYEPFGLVALEAMAAGAPVVASQVDGLAGVVRGAGRLVPADDPATLRAALRALLADRRARDQMSAAGLRRAAEHSWQAVAEQTLRAYGGITSVPSAVQTPAAGPQRRSRPRGTPGP